MTLLERHGFDVIRQRGSHVNLRRGATGCSVPLHRELKAGTLMGILRSIGMSADDLLAKRH
ncbi:type II toxin-antitoxin system HicA family toxin [Sandaracinobacteroides saxicola]|uniref:type II toxin-antitoxin system HicA family toxin n=1 Tax=Sandaracinobacteroides saxicola TaxID=2759707 RepID=UPI001FB1448F|nr:type II toxin-antitoxin system HicA family toxin [Sandaracinobacteroides saxicola]